MQLSSLISLVLSLSLSVCCSAFLVPSVSARKGTSTKMFMDGFAAATAAQIIGSSPINAEHMRSVANQPAISWQMLAKSEVREGLYGEYSVDVKEQERDNAVSTFKSKEETEKGKNKYNAVLLVLLVGSFVIPMVQYWWYIRDEDADYE